MPSSPRSLQIAQRVASVPPSGIRRFFDISATMKDVISLGIGEPDFTTPQHILDAGIEALRRGETHYTSNSGILELRQAIARKYEALYGVRFDPEDELLVTVGGSEALLLAMLSLVDPGDEVIVVEPSFVAYKPAVIFAGGVPIVVEARPENDFEVTGADIEAKITSKTRMIFIGYPNNPTGAVLPRERMLEIAALAEKHDLLVVSDELYDRLVYSGFQQTCFSALPGMKERTILVAGLSKNYAMTGWRVGFIAANPALLAAIRKVHQYIIMSAPTVAQIAAIEALENGEVAVEQMRQEYDARRKLLVGGLNAMGLPTFEPKGAFYCFPCIRSTGLTSEQFSEGLIFEEQVAAVPGSAFGDCGEGFVRMAYTSGLPQIAEALERIERFVKRHR
ncbi:MAG: aminotransferase class I/II-fold pyridoxal phosphate-dependent enzyme [Myxococcales bacterium]|jgi:aminotransferase|nr:aminotransferase class I/II-fold pyridoxal phosphate-dependent enzyme [Myxococcales bacterium]